MVMRSIVGRELLSTARAFVIHSFELPSVSLQWNGFLVLCRTLYMYAADSC